MRFEYRLGFRSGGVLEVGSVYSMKDLVTFLMKCVSNRMYKRITIEWSHDDTE